MNRHVQQEKCRSQECGAFVIYLPVGGVEMAVNPDPVPVVVDAPGRGWRETMAYQPHWATCVDIRGRLSRKRGLLRKSGPRPAGGAGA